MLYDISHSFKSKQIKYNFGFTIDIKEERRTESRVMEAFLQDTNIIII